MRATILICTYNRRGLLERTLRSLNAATRPKGWELQILVVANACSDGTHVLLERYREAATEKSWLPLSWFAQPVPGKSHSLNSAMTRLSGDLVAFVDDDHRVDAGYLQAVCKASETYPEADLFCGRILPDWSGSEPAWVYDRGPYRIYPLPVPRFDLGPAPLLLDGTTGIPGGGNLAIRTQLLPTVGSFNSGHGPTGHDLGGAEDLEWIRRALRLGARMQYVPAMLQYHYVDPGRLTLGYLIRKAYKRSASMMQFSQTPDARNGLPLYMYRKAVNYLLLGLTSFSRSARRYYLVRLAASLGEIKGFLDVSRSAED